MRCERLCLRCFFVVLLAISVFSCSAGTVIGVVQPTASVPVKATKKSIPVTLSKVLVLSPTSIEQVSGALTLEAKGTNAKAGKTAVGVVQTTDYNMVSSVAEAAMLNQGWKPISQAVLVAVSRSEEVQQRFRETKNVTLLQSALILGNATQADAIFLIRSVQVGYLNKPLVVIERKNCKTLLIQPAHVIIDAVLVSPMDGVIIWTGVSEVRSSDILQTPVEIPYGPQRAKFSRSYGQFQLTGMDDGNQCGYNSIPFLFCAVWDSPSAGIKACNKKMADRGDYQKLQVLFEMAVERLVEAIH